MNELDAGQTRSPSYVYAATYDASGYYALMPINSLILAGDLLNAIDQIKEIDLFQSPLLPAQSGQRRGRLHCIISVVSLTLR